MTTSTSEIDLLIQNARLRDEMEPYLDESVYLVDLDRMSTVRENEFLTSMLAWEKAPVLPISRWFEPELALPPHQGFDDAQLAQELDRVVGMLFEQNIVAADGTSVGPPTVLLDCARHSSSRRKENDAARPRLSSLAMFGYCSGRRSVVAVLRVGPRPRHLGV